MVIRTHEAHQIMSMSMAQLKQFFQLSPAGFAPLTLDANGDSTANILGMHCSTMVHIRVRLKQKFTINISAIPEKCANKK